MELGIMDTQFSILNFQFSILNFNSWTPTVFRIGEEMVDTHSSPEVFRANDNFGQ